MKKIGFIDYYISEWHANNYPVWFKEICEKTGRDYEIAYAYAREYVSPVDGLNTDEWCAKFGATRCDSIKEICEKSDYIIVLAPTNPETHLSLCSEAFGHFEGGRMYIDKTFAPDYPTAKEIFELAEKHNVTFFSTSALRYAADFDNLTDVKSVTTRYCGSNLEEYIIHQVESLVKVMNEPARKLKAEIDGEHVRYEVVFESGRSAFMDYAPTNGFDARIEFNDGRVIDKPVDDDYFLRLSAKILEFFETGKIDFNPEDTLEVMKIRDKAIEAKNKPNVWFEI